MTFRQPIVAAAAALAVVGACTPPPSTTAKQKQDQPPPPGEEAPQVERRPDLKALFKRELEELPTQVPVAGRGWSARVPGLSPKVSPAGKEDGLEIPIGTESAITCTVFDRVIDTALSLKGVVDKVKQDGAIKPMAVRPLAAISAGELPILALEMQYLAPSEEKPGNKAAGQLLVAAIQHPARPIICLHDEVGYSRTFLRVLSTVASSLKVDGFKRPDYVRIDVATVDGHPLGFRRTVAWQKDSKLQVLSTDARLLPDSATSLIAEDGAGRSTYDDDRLIDGIWAVSRNGSLQLQIEAKREGATDKYVIAGTRQGSPVKGTLTVPGGIPSPRVLEGKLAKAMGQGGAFDVTHESYNPRNSPLKLTKQRYQRAEGAPPGEVTGTSGKTTIKAKVAPAGHIVEGTIVAGGRTMQMQVIVHRDELKD